MGKRVIDAAWAQRQLASVEAVSPHRKAHGDDLTAHLKAAATLDVFTEDLVPLNAKRLQNPLRLLREFSRPANLSDGRVVWRLTDDQRRMTLTRLTKDELRAAIEQNPDRELTATQIMLEKFLDGDGPDLQICDITEVAAIRKVAGRYRAQLDNLPSEAELEDRMAVLRLANPFRELTKSGFHGRRKVLRIVREYLGISGRRSTVSKFTTLLFEDVLSFHEKPPLVIYGTGGIGKSTLLAKTILEHSFDNRGSKVPFVYLNFESLDLSIEEPLTIVAEAASQIATQIPESRKEAGHLIDHAYKVISQTAYGEEQESASGRARQSQREDCVEHFMRFLSTWSPKDLPLLFAIDTFELVQISATNWPDKLWFFLEQLQKSLPRLRVVVAGRRPVEGVPSDNVELDEMDRTSAIQFLSESLTDMPEVHLRDLEHVANIVGGNPLSLKLAASALRRIGVREALGGIQRRHWYLIPLRDSQIQGQLYGRILDHIDDQDVRKLAHPGLVLRRITPRVIREVLAEPCEIDIPNEKAAIDLCNRLESYADLVTRDLDGSLRHREDVRRIMLPTLTAEQPAKVASIHKAAVKYYEKRSNDTGNVAHRTEELYHRLVIGDEDALLAERWIDEARERLADYEEEFTVSSRVFLRTRLRLPIDDDLFEQAAIEVWEREAVRRAEKQLVLKNPEKALKILRARERRSGHPRIVRLEAELLDIVAKGEGENEVFQRGINAALEQNNLGHYIELSIAYLRSLEDGEKYAEALEVIKKLRKIAGRSLWDETRLQLELMEIRMLRKLSADPPKPGQHQNAAQLYLALNPEILAANKNISIQAAAELGEVPAVMARALSITPPAPLDQNDIDLSKLTSTFSDDHQLIAAIKAGDGNDRTTDIVDHLIDPSDQSFRMQVAEQLMESPPNKKTMDALVQLYQMSIK
jgi:hypothetical protein